MSRTEEEILLQESIEVVLGGKKYKIRPLKIRESREWRKKLAELLGVLPSYANVTTDNPEEFKGAISAMMVALPDQVTDLFFAYAKDLDRDAIEDAATDMEVAEAFKKVVTIAFPLAQALPEVAEKLSQ
jgi:hypothetical protein